MKGSSHRLRGHCLDIGHLPASVVRRLLEHLALTDRLALSQTCASLRAAALLFPHIWSQFCLTQQSPAAWRVDPIDEATMHDPPKIWQCIVELLGRSAPVPTRASLFIDVSRSYTQLAHLLTSITRRSEELTLNLGTRGWGRSQDTDEYPWPLQQYFFCIANVDNAAWVRISGPLSTPAPHLRALSLYACDYDFNTRFSTTIHDLVLRHDIFGGESPQLRSCRLRGLTMPAAPYSCAAFSRLTFFDYQPPWPANLHAEEVDNILYNMPQLQTLGLAINAFRDDRQTSREPSQSSLQQVSIIFYQSAYEDDFGSAASYFQRVGTSQLSLDLCGHRFHRPAFDFWSALPLPLQHPEKINIFNNIAISSVGTFNITSPWPTFELLDDPELYTDLNCITLCDTHWPHDAPFPPAPRLTCLHVIMVGHDAGLFTSGWPSAWDCPLLRELQMSYLPEQPVGCPSIALADVHAFIASNLKFSSERLAKLTLSGFAAIADPEPGLALLALQRVADEIAVQEEVVSSAKTLRGSAMRRTTPSYAPTDVFQPLVDISGEWDELRTDESSYLPLWDD